jgi:hypothetical protein
MSINIILEIRKYFTDNVKHLDLFLECIRNSAYLNYCLNIFIATNIIKMLLIIIRKIKKTIDDNQKIIYYIIKLNVELRFTYMKPEEPFMDKITLLEKYGRCVNV